MFESSYSLMLNKNGKPFAGQPIRFQLSSCLQFLSPVCEMTYLRSDNEWRIGDWIVCSLRSPEGDISPVFTGAVSRAVPLSEGKIGLVLENDLSERPVNISFVGEEARNILVEVLEQSGVADYRIEIPNITIKRFSFVGNAKQALLAFQDLLNRYDIYYSFFDENNQYNFIKESDFPVSGIQYVSGKNILHLGDASLSSFALPVVAGQIVQVNGKSIRVERSLISLSHQKSRTDVHWEAL